MAEQAIAQCPNDAYSADKQIRHASMIDAFDSSCAGGADDDHAPRLVTKYRSGRLSLEVDQVVDEERLALQLNGRDYCEITCSPWSVEELVVGRLFCEGLLAGSAVIGVDIDEKRQVVNVRTEERLEKSAFPTLQDNASPLQHSPSEPALLEPAEVSRLSMQLEAASELFHRTGGVHGAALARDGKMLAYFVDMGRHNAVDKLAGWCFLNGIDASDAVMVFSGRLPLEIMEKAVAIGCAAVIACGAPTNQSLDLAEERGVTVIGFAKADRFNVYTHAWRIVEEASLSSTKHAL